MKTALILSCYVSLLMIIPIKQSFGAHQDAWFQDLPEEFETDTRIPLLKNKTKPMPSLSALMKKTKGKILSEQELALAKNLLEKGAFVDEPMGKFFITPLKCAVARNDLALVKLLLAHGADANSKALGISVYSYAWRPTANLEIIKLLSQAHGSIVFLIGFIHLVKNRHLSTDELAVIRSHIKNGMSIDKIDNFGRTPLILAAMKGDERLARILVIQGANQALRDKEQKNAYDHAKEHDSLRKLLIDPYVACE